MTPTTPRIPDLRVLTGLLLLAVGGAIHITPDQIAAADPDRLSIAAVPAHDGGLIYTASLLPPITDADLRTLLEGP